MAAFGGFITSILGLRSLGQQRKENSIPVVLASDPDEDESLIVLRRIDKSLEALRTIDSATRQRVSVDNTVAVNGTVAGLTAAAGISGIAGHDQRQFIDQARAAYNTGIRSNLSWE